MAITGQKNAKIQNGDRFFAINSLPFVAQPSAMADPHPISLCSKPGPADIMNLIP